MTEKKLWHCQYFSEEDTAKIDALVEKYGSTRAMVIRLAVRELYKKERRKK